MLRLAAVLSLRSGTWLRMTDSNNGRRYFAPAVLTDGRLVLCGGEYSNANGSKQQGENGDHGNAELTVVANGIASTAVPVSVITTGRRPESGAAGG
jgi:hypothetical protein